MTEEKGQEKKLPDETDTEVPVEDTAGTIRRMQSEWAQKNPQKAHEVYPDVYDNNGTTIRKQTDT